MDGKFRAPCPPWISDKKKTTAQRYNDSRLFNMKELAPWMTEMEQEGCTVFHRQCVAKFILDWNCDIIRQKSEKRSDEVIEALLREVCPKLHSKQK